MKCGEAQGFFYSKPLPGAEFSRWLRTRVLVQK
jgi:EAL domain-containing protein (putative c-di-GMP-specific phosphodiesterase class I)